MEGGFGKGSPHSCYRIWRREIAVSGGKLRQKVALIWFVLLLGDQSFPASTKEGEMRARGYLGAAQRQGVEESGVESEKKSHFQNWKPGSGNPRPQKAGDAGVCLKTGGGKGGGRISF